MSADRIEERQGITLIRPDIFAPFRDITAAVSTRRGGVSDGAFGLNLSFNVGDVPDSVAANRKMFYSALGISADMICFQKQVHGRTVRSVASAGVEDACDGLVTASADVFLAVSIADCLPVLLYDPVHAVTGAVHAGWRGAASRILAVAFELMHREFGTRGEDLLAYIGPGAGPCCYEVGPEVWNQFEPRFRRKGEKTRLDLKSAAAALLLEQGVTPPHIAVSDHCTICEPEHFHSYRRDRDASGRGLAVIGRRAIERV